MTSISPKPASNGEGEKVVAVAGVADPGRSGAIQVRTHGVDAPALPRPLVPKFSLGMSLSRKLCFLVASKQSFETKCVPKLSLGTRNAKQILRTKSSRLISRFRR
jgi:hypothetical protein